MLCCFDCLAVVDHAGRAPGSPTGQRQIGVEPLRTRSDTGLTTRKKKDSDTTMTIELTTEQVAKVLLTALQSFRDEAGTEAPAHRLQILAAVTVYPNIQQFDLPNVVTGLAQSSISRKILDLTSSTKTHEPGPNFVQQYPDPEFRRRNLLVLTGTGEKFMKRLTERVNKALASDK